jgi:hypothetical protein
MDDEPKDLATILVREDGSMVFAFDLTEPIEDRYLLANMVRSGRREDEPLIAGWAVLDAGAQDAAERVVEKFDTKEAAVALWRRLTDSGDIP